MENSLTNDSILNLSLDVAAKAHLKTAAAWAKIIAIAGFIGLVLGILQEIKGAGRVRASVGNAEAVAIGQGINYVFLGIFYLIILFLYVYLLRFANQTSAGIAAHDQEQFNLGIGNLRSFLKLLGIVSIILVVCCLISILAIMAGAAMGRR